MSVYQGNGMIISAGAIYGTFDGSYRYAGRVEDGGTITYTSSFEVSEEDKQRIDKAASQYIKLQKAEQNN